MIGPPTSHAAVAPTPPIAAQMPSALLRSAPSANVVVTIDSAVGVMIAAAMPCTTRAAISASTEPANPQASEASANSAVPDHEHAAPPEQVGCATAEQQQAAEAQQVRAQHPLEVARGEAAGPRRSTAAPRRTIAESRMTMKNAVHSRASAFQRRGSGSDGVGRGGFIAQPYRLVLENKYGYLHQDHPVLHLLPWRPCARTGTAAGSRTRSTSSGSAGRCSSCASCCSVPSASPTCATGLPNASPNVLAQRLRDLEQAAIVRRRKLPPPASSWIYELTDWGHELKPIVISLGKWALHSPSFPDEAPVGTDSVILALGTFFDAEAAGDLRARYELRLGEHTFDVRIADGAIALERGSVADPGRGHRDRFHDAQRGDLERPRAGRRAARRRHQDRRRSARRHAVPGALPPSARDGPRVGFRTLVNGRINRATAASAAG